LVLPLKVVDPFWVDFCISCVVESNFILLHVDIQFSQHYLLKSVLFPLCILDTFVENQFTGHIWCISGFPVSLICASIFMPVLYCFFSFI
jgi:hypothetical protein